MGNARPLRRDATGNIRVEQECLHDFGLKSNQPAEQSDNHTDIESAAGAETDDVNPELPQQIDERPARPKTENHRFPASPIEPRDKLHQRTLRSSRIEIGDAESNANRAMDVWHSVPL